MNIPNIIIEALEHLPFEIKGQILCAVVSYIESGTEPDELDEMSRGLFRFARTLIDPVMKRRRQQAEYRRRRREGKAASRPRVEKSEKAANTVKADKADKAVLSGTTRAELSPVAVPAPALTRQQRRKLERMKAAS